MPRININFEDYGTIAFIEVFKSGMPALVGDVAKTVAFWVARELKKRIVKQEFAHAPLSRPYLLYKKKKGLNEGILMATGDYVQSIAARPKLYRGKTVWTVSPGVGIHRTSGLSYVTLARLLEFGNPRGHLPPRPHWRPVWSLARRQFGDIIDDAVNDLVEKAKKEANRNRNK